MRIQIHAAAAGILTAAAAATVLLLVPPDALPATSFSLIFLHVPFAMTSVIAFILSAVYSVLYLRTSRASYAVQFHSCAKLALFFTVLTTVSGSIWAKLAWGSWWNWDPRETSIVYLMLLYMSYFVLASSVKGRDDANRLMSVYLIFAAVLMPLFVFIIPRISPSLHPDTIINSGKKIHLSAEMRTGLAVCSAAAVSLFLLLRRYMTIRAGTGGKPHE